MDTEYPAEKQDLLEDVFYCGQDELQFPLFQHLSTRPTFLFESAPMDEQEGVAWKAKYNKHCQLMFSSFQHCWHKKDSEGQRQPLPYCRFKRSKAKSKKNVNVA